MVLARLIYRPVTGKLFRADHKDAAVQKLEVLDHGEGFKGLSQTDAVGDNTAVVFQYFIDCPLDAILLKVIKRIPYFAVKKPGTLIEKPALLLFIQIVFKNMEKSLEVNKLRLILDI